MCEREREGEIQRQRGDRTREREREDDRVLIGMKEWSSLHSRPDKNENMNGLTGKLKRVDYSLKGMGYLPLLSVK